MSVAVPSHHESTPAATPRVAAPVRVRVVAATIAAAIDAAIAVYGATLLLVMLSGGFQLAFVSASGAAKPLLVLMLLVPTRMALGVETWASRHCAMLLAATRASSAVRAIPEAARDVIFALVVTRVATFTIGFVSAVMLAPSVPSPISIPVRWQKFVETFAVFDSGWYFDIASRGYYFATDAQSSVAFFPLYPLLMRIVAPVFGVTDEAVWLAGIAVSWVSFVGALLALHSLTVRLTGNRDVARRTVLYVAVFPFSFYFMRVYTEALFLLTTVLAFRGAIDGRWGRAGMFGALAAATRPNGVLIAIPLLLLTVSGQPRWRVLTRRVFALAPIPLAVVGYSAYVYTLSGHPLAWLEAQEHWNYTIGNPPHRHLLTTLTAIEQQGLYAWFLQSETAPIDFFYSLLSIVFLALVPGIVRRFGWAFGVYVLIGILLPLSGNVLVGMGRYASVLFPAFMLAATVRSARAHEAILIVSCLFRTFFLALFVTWHPLH